MINLPNRERWADLWTRLALPEPEGWFRRLIDAYNEPQRHYHNLTHIGECLTEFDAARVLAENPAAVELGLWFHDAVYEPKAADNEERSAALAEVCLQESKADIKLGQSVVILIMATKTHQVGANADAALMVDVDLSILGRSEERFDEYEIQITREYSWVAAEIFAAKRAEILRGFLSRGRIFATKRFYDKYEGQARQNLARSIAKLTGNSGM